MCIPGFVFWIFEKVPSELASKSTLYGYVMITKGSAASRLRENYLPYSYDLYIFGKSNRPRCASREAYVLLFSARIVEIDVAEVGTQNNEICSCGPDRRGSNPVDDIFFVLFLTFWYVRHYLLLLVLNFREIGQN